jgi:hypothetical protein
VCSKQSGRTPSLVVVAEGAAPKDMLSGGAAPAERKDSLRKSLTPFADTRYGQGSRVFERSGSAAEKVAMELQRLTDHETFPQALGSTRSVRHGHPAGPPARVELRCGRRARRS